MHPNNELLSTTGTDQHLHPQHQIVSTGEWASAPPSQYQQSAQVSYYHHQQPVYYSSNSADWNDNTAPISYNSVVDQSTGHYSMSAMFGSQNTYGGYNNNYGNNPYYSPHNNDSVWINNCDNNQQNRVNYREQDSAIASDSLYGYDNSYSSGQSLDGSTNTTRQIESGISGLSINQSRNSDDYGSLASIVSNRKTTTWASIASQPAKSQPKSLKSKMAASGLTGSNSKHLPPTLTMDVWETKNGSMANSSSGVKSIPPPAVITTPSVPPQIVPVSVSPREETPSPTPVQQQPIPPPHVSREDSWTSNGNSSPSGSVANSDCSPRPSQTPTLPPPPPPPTSMSRSNLKGPLSEHNGNYNQNKYSNQRNNYPMDNQSYIAKNSAPREAINSSSSVSSNDNLNPQLILDKLCVENNYNPEKFELVLRDARFFIIKSYSEDDIHRSIKYSIWCSTEHGNKKLDNAFRQQEDKGPIYLFFSVNRSGHFCGVAQMMSPVDYNASSGVWSQDKWKGQFKVKWIYVKDVPNEELRHIKLENNENKPVTNSRDTQEVPIDKGKKVLSIIHNFENKTSIFDDFLHYEKKQEEELHRKPEISSSPPPPSNYTKMPMPNSNYNSGMSRDNSMPYRGNNSYKPRSYMNDREDHHREYRNDFRNDHRNDFRGDYRNERVERNDYPRDHRDRNLDPRNEYRDNHLPRDNRDFREYREQPYHRENYHREYHPQPHREMNREYSRDQRERNDYRAPADHRDYRENRERVDYRDRVNHRVDDRHQSWRN